MITMVECHPSCFIRRSETRIVHIETINQLWTKCKQKEACIATRVRLSIFHVVNQRDAEQILSMMLLTHLTFLWLVGLTAIIMARRRMVLRARHDSYLAASIE